MLFEICKYIQFHSRMCVPLQDYGSFSNCHVSSPPFYDILQNAVWAKSLYKICMCDVQFFRLNFLLLSSAVILCSWPCMAGCSLKPLHIFHELVFCKHWPPWDTRWHFYSFMTLVLVCTRPTSSGTLRGHTCSFSSRLCFFLIWEKSHNLPHVFSFVIEIL